MPEERSFVRPLQTIAAAVAAFIPECALVQESLRPHSWWPGVAAWHFGVTAALFLWYRFSPGVRTDVRMPLLLLTGTAALGPVGPVATLVVMALTRWFMRSAITFDEWYQALFPEGADDQSGELARQAALADLDNPASLAPFSEMLSFGSLHQKQVLIALMNRSFRPAFGPILKLALTDANNAVRVQAATAMNRIENMLHAQTMELKRHLAEQPDNADAMLALARHYDQYLYSRILDTRREEEMRGRAVQCWTRYLTMRPDDVQAQVDASRLFLRCGRYAEAAELLKQAIAQGGATAQAQLWYMECLYHLSRYDDVRRTARLIHPDAGAGAKLPSAAQEAVRLWETQGAVP
jgi:hypothetical protein